MGRNLRPPSGGSTTTTSFLATAEVKSIGLSWSSGGSWGKTVIWSTLPLIDRCLVLCPNFSNGEIKYSRGRKAEMGLSSGQISCMCLMVMSSFMRNGLHFRDWQTFDVKQKHEISRFLKEKASVSYNSSVIVTIKWKKNSLMIVCVAKWVWRIHAFCLCI